MELLHHHYSEQTDAVPEVLVKVAVLVDALAVVMEEMWAVGALTLAQCFLGFPNNGKPWRHQTYVRVTFNKTGHIK